MVLGRRLLRVATLILGVGYVTTGVWALASPASWLRSYPGFGRHWLGHDTASPHLVADLSVGFLAVGIALAVAACSWRTGGRQVAGAALFAHAAPHFIYHVSHPDRELPGLDVVLGVWGLAPQAVLGLVLIATTVTGWRRAEHSGPVSQR